MPKATLKDLREFYLNSGQAARESKKFVKEFSFQKVLREISFYPIWFFLRIGMTANQITLFSLLIGLVGCASIATGTYLTSIIGALLVTTALFLDYVDGFVARYTKTTSTLGAIFDGMYVLLLQIIALLAIGIGIFRASNPNLYTLPNYFVNFQSPTFYLVIGLWTSLILALRCWIFCEFSSVVTLGDAGEAKMELSSETPINIFIRSHNLIMLPVYLWPYFLVIASILQLLYVFLLIHAVYHTLVIFAYAFYIYARRNDGQKITSPESPK